MNIHSFGDSHAYFSFFYVSGVHKRTLGPVTMKSIGKEYNIKRIKPMFEDYYIKMKDVIIFCFGEIDCRTHDKTRDEDIEDLIINYIHTVKEVRKEYPNIWIMSITPAAYNIAVEDINFPFVGTDKERSEFTCKMNTLLKNKCESENIPYLNVYDDYKDDNGMLNVTLTKPKDIHIFDTSFVKLRLEELFLKNFPNG